MARPDQLILRGRRRSSSLVAYGVVISLAATAVAGCSQSPRTTGESPPPTEGSGFLVPDASGQPTLPLAAILESSADDLETLAAAENKLRRDCMAERGYPQVDEVRYMPGGDFDVHRRYGHRTVEHAREHGYRPKELAHWVNAATEAPSDFTLEPGYQEALLGEVVHHEDGSFGPSDSSCQAVAAEAVYGTADRRYGFADWDTLLAIDAESYQRLLASPEFATANAMWSECMADRGFGYADPQAALADFPTDFDDRAVLTTPPSASEIETAVADAGCRDEVDLLHTYLAVEAEVQRDLLEERHAQVQSVSEQLHAALRRAREILTEEASG